MAPLALSRCGTTSRHALAIRAPAARRALAARPARVLAPQIRAESRNSDGFLTGFVVGGVVFGALGFLFAPQISKALLGDDQKLKLPRFLEDEKDPEATKEDLIEKIAQLNASIDEVAAQLKPSQEKAAAVVEGETIKISS